MLRRHNTPQIPYEVRKKVLLKRRRAEKKSKLSSTTRPGKGSKITAMFKSPSLVDQLRKDFTVPVKQVRYYPAMESREVYPIERVNFVNKMPNHPAVYVKYGIYSGNELCQKLVPNRDSAYNKAVKIFGKISKERHFSFILQCIILSGMSRKDFKSLMRIRDLYVRGLYHEYKKNAIKFAFSLPCEVRRTATMVTV